MMKKICSLILILFFFSNFSSAQSIAELNPAQYFDFWVGSWNLTYQEANGTTARATNEITKILNGTTIQENFEVLSGSNKGYIGKSWSVYDPKTETWYQTWVDNQGAYLTFTGKTDGDTRIFSRTTTNSQGKTITQRMVFYNIKEESFTWDWEQSEDDGKNWELLWRIEYQRE